MAESCIPKRERKRESKRKEKIKGERRFSGLISDLIFIANLLPECYG